MLKWAGVSKEEAIALVKKACADSDDYLVRFVLDESLLDGLSVKNADKVRRKFLDYSLRLSDVLKIRNMKSSLYTMCYNGTITLSTVKKKYSIEYDGNPSCYINDNITKIMGSGYIGMAYLQDADITIIDWERENILTGEEIKQMKDLCSYRSLYVCLNEEE